PRRNRGVRALASARARVARLERASQLRPRRRRDGDRRPHGARLRARRRAVAPLVLLSTFRVRPLLTANAAMFLAMTCMFAMFFFNTLYIQQVLGYGPLEAGLAFLPFTAGIMISASLASQLAPRLGVRPVAIAGFLLAAGGLVLLTQLPVDGSYAANVLP